ncbi:Hypothetical predicted protein [Pelobates cultripes]|uniref:Uncharacterized protein n=1 Tax=Pelobates cultripes TaxID=61616 RepID=A0AAD1SSV6_PELCU|nr:Hypothetical predicted protein [Pelobates cultripes]
MAGAMCEPRPITPSKLDLLFAEFWRRIAERQYRRESQVLQAHLTRQLSLYSRRMKVDPGSRRT